MIARCAVTALTAVLLSILPSSALAGVKYKVLHSFGAGTDGATPYGPLTLHSGKLYGVTIAGGNGCTGGCGTAFELAPLANGRWKGNILYSFPGTNYYYPQGGLVFDAHRNLYGTMLGGVFELSPGSSGWNFSALYTNGAGPGLLTDTLGHLYGEMGPGQTNFYSAIGELSSGTNDWDYTQLYSFCTTYCPDGFNPPTPPVWDGKGNMFGTTSEGGIIKSPCRWTFGCGVIYDMTPNGDGTWAYHVLHRFASSKNDGQNPYSGLVMDKAGNFYGGTWAGGRYGLGTVFKLAYSGGGWKVTHLYDFPDCAHGCGVDGTLVLDKYGNLYGIVAGGPASGCGGLTCGVVFKLSPQKTGKWKYSVVYELTEEGGGAAPFYGVILDSKGHLFGVTSQFGKYGFGTAFEITP